MSLSPPLPNPPAAASKAGEEHFNDPILLHARRDFPLLDANTTIQGALETVRRQGVGERVIYFYVVDERGRLAGVLPTRRLLTAGLDQRLVEVMVPRVLAIPATATVLEACELFVLHKFLAFPVVDAERRVVGVVDVSLFAEELLQESDAAPERAENAHAGQSAPLAIGDEVFEALGFRLSQLRDASPWRAFRLRFPWLLATMAGGTLCALLSGAFETTLAKSLIISFFLTMVLGLNESVSIQSMTVTIQALRSAPLTWRWFGGTVRREAPTAALLGAGCGAAVGLIVWLWQRDARAAGVIGSAIAGSLVAACGWGLAVPTLLHALKLDPKIAAGPVTLALTDLGALALYFSLARWVL